MRHLYDDGGRAASGFQGSTGDCCARAFAIAAERPYSEVYDLINELAKSERLGKRKRKISAARTGVFKATAHKLAYELNPRVRWVSCMKIGQGCKVHLADGELPMGRLVVSVSRHYTAVIDGNIHDTYDPRRDKSWMFEPDRGQELKANQGRNKNGVWTEIGGRCVYGYWDFTNLR